MKNRSPLGLFSCIRSLTVATLGFVAMLASPLAQARSGGGSGSVGYNIPLQIAQGVVPLTFSYPLVITAPSTILATPLTPVTITLVPSVVSAPAGVTNA